MAPLRTLGFASLTPRVLEFLERNKIVTVEDFVSQELDSGVEDPEIQKFKSELATFLEECHGKWENGDEMLQKNLQAGSLSTGFESLDSLLKGGLKDGTITELVGPSSSGKTQLCMRSAACVAYHHKFSVAYVDASSSFSAERVLQMMCGRRCSSIAIEDDVKEAMRRIFCFKVYDVHGLLEVLHSLYDPARTHFNDVRWSDPENHCNQPQHLCPDHKQHCCRGGRGAEASARRELEVGPSRTSDARQGSRQQFLHCYTSKAHVTGLRCGGNLLL
ncbi:DNA repair protein RAD51 homolog 4 [Selaginella moellendorffii]|uniref:DNA repair protein RAD51 homolog 4 n=1 Tax=Selaginella moellendorffii TaxID=88036 RepID=UPI000D1C8C07|nr:DNA repair protein RAD51 homolog 4 [Selaginella moellendorffii]XP_024521093.1 DNA repair protein RAD51 homolog 4 [Selaginella moellendorffii]XP_024521096.1 DNA repair protein RAD51 homolog 4 [Selaginella moellendorffii]|eukprot:XP_024521091.1 DNA repair protein RAD51 homolog 4 [Selaginella moellendorffii]